MALLLIRPGIQTTVVRVRLRELIEPGPILTLKQNPVCLADLPNLGAAGDTPSITLVHLVNDHPNLKECCDQSTVTIATRKDPSVTSDNNWVDLYRIEVKKGEVWLTFLDTKDLPDSQRDASFRELVRCALKISEGKSAKAYLVLSEKRTVYWDQFNWGNATMDDTPGAKADTATWTWNDGVADGWEFDDARLIVRSEAFNANNSKSWKRVNGKASTWTSPDNRLELSIDLPAKASRLVLKGSDLNKHQDKTLEFWCKLEPGVEFLAATVEPRPKATSK
jgi:hypothetical protein